ALPRPASRAGGTVPHRAGSIVRAAGSAPQVTNLRALAARRRALRTLAFRGGASAGSRPLELAHSFHPQVVVNRYRSTILARNRALSGHQAEQIAASVLDASDRNDVDPRLVLALVACESNFRHTARSRVGALGLGQLMPRTAASLGVTDPF